MENLYGNVEETVSSGVGPVQGYRMTSYGVNDNGSLEIHFTKSFESGKELTLRTWINPVDPERVTAFGDDTQEKAVAKAITKVNRTIKQIVRNYVDDDTYVAAMKGVTDFNSLVEATKSILPDNFDQIEGTLVVGYKDNGYLSTPGRLEWDAETSRFLPFFSTDPDARMCGLGKLHAVKPEAEDAATETQAAVNW